MKNLLIIFIAISISILANPANGHGMGHGETCEAGNTEHFCDPALNLECANSKCECIFGFIVNADKVCVDLAGSTCGGATNNNCYPDGWLECNPDSKCQCTNPTEQIFDTALKACALTLEATNCPMPMNMKAGAEPGCVSNASCIMEGSGDQMKHLCKCNSGFVPSNDKKTCVLDTTGSSTEKSGSSSSFVFSSISLLATVLTYCAL